jgi:CubicO group peptidase (beta-lactamase class C family)
VSRPSSQSPRNRITGASLLLVLLVLGQATPAARAEDSKPGASPRFEWQTATPQSEGFSAAKLAELHTELAERATQGFILIRDDRIIDEWYGPGFSVKVKHGTASMAKAIVGGVALAVAINDGRIHLDDPAYRYIPQWRDDPGKSLITIRHLGSHTSGIMDADPDNLIHAQLPSWKGEFWRQLPVPDDPFTLARDRAPLLFQAGARFHYSNPGIAMLGYAVTSALRDAPQKDIRTLLRERIMRPIGVPDSDWQCGYNTTTVVAGLPVICVWGGGSYTPRAVARIGRLMLRQGNWEGVQLIAPEVVRQITSDSGLPGSVNAGWWTNGGKRVPAMPRDAFWAWGKGDEILLVVPSLKLVMVRMGKELSPMGYDLSHDRFLFEPLMDCRSG